MINDEKMKVGDEIAFHWGDEAPDTVIVITHWDGCERCVVCVKESAEMDENRKAFSTCNPVVKADGGREMNDDTISRRAAIDALESIGSIDTEADKEYARSVFEALPSTQSGSAEKDIRAMCGECDAWNIYKNYPSAQPEPLTDKEQRIFLAAMGREEKVCKEIDAEMTREPYEDSLVRTCHEITRKVKGTLWKM